MTQAVVKLFEEANRLSESERADLADMLVESLGHDIPPAIEEIHLAEVRRRIAQIDAGEVDLIPGETALAEVRARLAAASRKD